MTDAQRARLDRTLSFMLWHKVWELNNAERHKDGRAMQTPFNSGRDGMYDQEC